MYRFFIKEDLSKYDLSSIEYSTTAGEALNPEVYEQWKRATGFSIYEGFGQTETTLSIYNPVGSVPKSGSMGIPSPLYDVDLILPDGTPAPVGETGEIVIRTDKHTPCGLFMGYYRDEEKTREAWSGGVYHTGDTAWRDEDGYFFYVGRTDDVIKSSGYRIGPFEIENVKGDLNFKDIDFSYVKGEQVLKHFDLWVKSGQKIAIVGATGSGKTTVVNLLTRFYDIDGGVITLDGQDIRNIPVNKLRGSIGIVLQDTVIFSDTIAQNIRYGRIDATDEEIVEAAKIARVDDFASKLSDGYNTMLTEGGSNLSQGQRQLISIARAVLADPKILILDEATSSIDTRTEMHIQEAMVALMKGRTSLIIAHRLSTIRDADKIVVISGGKVVEAGDHDELLAQKGEYYKLYQSQFAGIAT